MLCALWVWYEFAVSGKIEGVRWGAILVFLKAIHLSLYWLKNFQHLLISVLMFAVTAPADNYQLFPVTVGGTDAANIIVVLGADGIEGLYHIGWVCGPIGEQIEHD